MKALVVGCGRMGGFHRRVLRDLGYDVTTVDPRPGIADHERVPHQRFEVVCIATPIEHLADCAAEWIGHGGSLLIEKPMAPDAATARELADELADQAVAVGYVERFNPCLRGFHPMSEAVFQRWNTRPSSDLALDLQSHDIDLARYLSVSDPIFDTRAAAPFMSRRISGGGLAVNLLDHDTSPLHAQWHAFLSGRADPATPADAVAVLEALGRYGEGVPAPRHAAV